MGIVIQTKPLYKLDLKSEICGGICPKMNFYLITPSSFSLQLPGHRRMVFWKNSLLLIFEEKETKNRVL